LYTGFKLDFRVRTFHANQPINTMYSFRRECVMCFASCESRKWILGWNCEVSSSRVWSTQTCCSNDGNRTYGAVVG